MEDQKHECRICWKSFVNGRALGGHMRSHMLNHPLPLHTASSSMPDLLQDRESETESSKKPTRKRSRPNRRSLYVSSAEMRPKTSQEVSESCTIDQEPDADADEEVAFSLMMLSRDKWEKEESDDEKKKKKKWFECETCGKGFNSYQALGGHRASHKKKRALEGSTSSSSSCVIVVSDEKKSNGHECPICLKVFSSGQALGGHKRSHAATRSGIISMIDLNLPAPSEEDEDQVSCVF